MRFFTSDWHLGHANVINFDQRPFHSLREMRDTLVQNYNAVVGPNDTCYFLGDMIWGQTEDAEAIKDLNGHKILIPGNHDNKRSFHLFDEVFMKFSTTYINGNQCTLSHCPLIGVWREETYGEGNWHGEKKYGSRFSVANNQQFHLHGHIHADQFDIKRGKQWDVGVRGNLYFPVSEIDIASWVSSITSIEEFQRIMSEE